MDMKKNAWKVHRWLSRQPGIVSIALKVRNQMTAIIDQYLHLPINHSENGEEHCLRKLGPSIGTFVDVGANVGEWSALALRYSKPDVCGVLFEPGDNAYRRLKARFGDDKRILLHQKAVSDFDGSTFFFEAPDCGESSSLLNLDPDAVKINVEVVTLDRQLPSFLQGRRLDFLKIDAEGHDLRVIKGAAELLDARRISYLQFEYNDSWRQTGSTLKEAIEFLKAKGYTTYMIRPEGMVPFRLSDYGEYFFYSNFIAVSQDASI